MSSTPLRDRAGLQVRAGAGLERDPAILHPLSDRPEGDEAVLLVRALDGDVFGDPHAVAEPHRMAVEQRSAMLSTPSASPACTVAGKHARASTSNASFRPEAGNPASGPAMSKPTTPRSRCRTASSAISMPRSRWRIALTSWPARMLLRSPRTRRRPHRARTAPPRPSRRAEPALQVLLGRPAHLAVDDAVCGQVLHELARDAGQAIRGLHDRDGEVEGLQVVDERTRIGPLGEPGREFGRRRGRQLDADRSAISMIVCGRRPPSRWSCSEILGRDRSPL